jgi:serine phosphatase RsbU (regulator of sigma subunit)
MRDGVLADLVGYLGRRPWEDDLTILVLRLPAG